MKKDFAMLAHTYKGQDLTGWLCSRKLNGWGAMWDGGITRGKPATDVPWSYRNYGMSTGLWTIGRNNKPKVIYAPDWWLDMLPSCPLQGELWFHDDLAAVKSICGQKDAGLLDERWHNINYMIYNSKPYCLWTGLVGRPERFYNNFSYSVRMQQVQDFTKFNDIVFLLHQTQIKSKVHLEEMFLLSQKLGWEGLMLVNPDSYYEDYRSYNLLKMKPEFDAEAKIIGFEDGKGKHVGKMGALLCTLKWNEKIQSITGGTSAMVGSKVTFKIGGGFSDEQREWDYVNKHFCLDDEIHFTFLNVSKDGVPCSCNYAEV